LCTGFGNVAGFAGRLPKYRPPAFLHPGKRLFSEDFLLKIARRIFCHFFVEKAK
jgi:hypothetical protein